MGVALYTATYQVYLVSQCNGRTVTALVLGWSQDIRSYFPHSYPATETSCSIRLRPILRTKVIFFQTFHRKGVKVSNVPWLNTEVQKFSEHRITSKLQTPERWHETRSELRHNEPLNYLQISVSRGALRSVHVNWYTFSYAAYGENNPVIMLKIQRATAPKI